MKDYNFSTIEKKWRQWWDTHDCHTADESSERPAYYCLDMFPYPSGSGLHVGHWRNYVLSDVWARYKRLQGFEVLHPIGWDAFGLPAENDAIKKGIHPTISIASNIATMKRQLHEIGAMYDWSRELNTTDPDYYRWTQWIFLQMYHAGLAYRDNALINWCPSCATGLANEEVIAGQCERCGTGVEIRDLDQWKLKITAYAERLLNDLEGLEWPEKVKTMQANWIGRSEGAKITFQAKSAKSGFSVGIEVFTTRPDTLFGATYMVLAPEHPLVMDLVGDEEEQAVEEYAAEARKVKEIDRAAETRLKSGVALGASAVNPATGTEIPIWISDYVLMGYGTGAIMAVPGHDQRDFDFAKKFSLSIVEVIHSDESERDDNGDLSQAWAGDGDMVNSGRFDGLSSNEGGRQITSWLTDEGAGTESINYRLRDWIFSRQRYWGEPIPIVHCPKCGEVPVPDKDLPVLLPHVERYQPTGTGESPLAAIDEWVNVDCPKCSAPAKRDTDTMPTWAGSSWYFLRYPNPHRTDVAFNPDELAKWVPVHMYIGGVEHAILHLLYARFWTKVLHDRGHLSFDEPFSRLFNQGMITRRSYLHSNAKCANFGYIADQEIVWSDDDPATPTCGLCSQELGIEVAKMSKSKGNSVSPDELVGQHGADALRLYELFVGPPEQDAEWTDRGILGTGRFLSRLWKLVVTNIDPNTPPSDTVTKARHRLVKQVTEGMEGFKFNTTVSRLMEFVNFATSSNGPGGKIDPQTRDDLVVLVSPFAPHLAEELWSLCGNESSIFQNVSWPDFDALLASLETVTMAVQINGKVRATLELPVDAKNDEIERLALTEPNVMRHLEGETLKKVIVVPGRVVNMVV